MELTAIQKDIINAKICPYCKSSTSITTEEKIYGKTYNGRSIIKCMNYPKCDAYVGTHDDGSALGRLANRKLRLAKKDAHYYFDKIWKEKILERDTLYEQLSDFLNIPDEFTHIGMFSESTCIKVARWSQSIYNQLKQKQCKI